MSMKFNFLSSLILVLISTISFSQKQTLEEGWNSFINNDFESAKEKFDQAAKNEETKAEANLALSLYYQSVLNSPKAFEHFKLFFNASKNPYPALYALWKSESVSDGRGKLTEDRYDFHDQLNTDDKDGMYDAIKYEFINNHFLLSNDIKNAKKYAQNIKGIQKWQILGKFENISSSGFSKSHDAVKYPNDHIFYDKNGGKIEWFTVPVMSFDQWLAINNYMYTNNSIVYAQTFCKSEKEQEVEIRLGINGSYRLWLNDNFINEREEEQVNDIDAEIVKVKLNKGYNRILIQLGASEQSRMAAMVRVTDENGKPLEDLTYSNTYQEYTPSKNNLIKIVEHPIEKYYRTKIANGDSSFLNYILLANTYSSNDRTDAYLETVLEAKNKYENSIFLRYFLFDAYQELENETESSKELEAIKELAPESYFSLILLIEKEIDKENYDEATNYIRKVTSKFGENSYTLSKKLDIASSKDEMEELRRLANKAYQYYPDNQEFVYLKYVITKKLDNNARRASKILKKYIKNNFNSEVYELMANEHFEANDVARGLKIYEDLESQFPEETSYKITLAKIYYAMQYYEKSKEKYLEALAIAPYATSYFEGLAKTNEESGYTKEAIKYYNKVIEYGRYDFEAREKVRQLEGKEKLYEKFATVDEAENIFENSPTADEYPDDNSILLLDETHKIVHKDGATEEKHYEMIKVFNSSGVDNWKEYSIGVYGNQRLVVEEAKVFKKDGSKLDGEVNYSYVVFTDLEEGDAIYLVYRLETFNYGKLAQHFWGKHYFDYYIPSKSNSYSLLVHNDKSFNYEMLHDTIKPTITEHGNYKLYEWRVKDRTSIKSESYMPVLADIGATLHFSSFKDWNEISKWYIDLSQVKQKSDFELKNTISEIFNGKENLTDIEKAKAIYNYIVKNIRYSSVSFRQSGLIPQKASKVISSKLGDCKDVSTLFVTMCREVGLNAHLVLVNTRDNGDNSIYLPSIDFNHCIAKLNLDNDSSYYVELTSDLIPFAAQGKSLKNATILDITPETKSVKQLKSENQSTNKVVRNTDVSFKGNTMVIQKKSEKHGVYSGGMRSSYKNEGKEEQEKRMKSAISDEYIKTKLTNLSFDETLDNTSDVVNYNYTYEVEDAFTDVGGILILKLPWSERISTPSFISTETRNFPLDIWKYDISELDYEKLTITLPTDKNLVKEKPSDIVYNNKYFDYSLIHKKTKDNKLVVERSFNFKVDQVSPSDYEDFKNKFEKVIKADERQLGFEEI